MTDFLKDYGMQTQGFSNSHKNENLGSEEEKRVISESDDRSPVVTERHQKHNIYALLVGIDDYPSPVKQLNGCVNDIKEIEAYLKERLNKADYPLHLKTLINKEAKRANIIKLFETHLSQAGKDDIVLFYFSGHGSRETAPDEFGLLEGDGKNETLLCWDSRLESSWDLADKELACLVDKISKNGPQIVLILDACHSGSGSRDEDLQGISRHQEDSNRRRKAEEYYGYKEHTLQKILETPGTETEGPYHSGWKLPLGRHILMAACKDRETAKESMFDGKQRGAFSYYLLDALKNVDGSLSYRDLYKRTHVLVRNQMQEQSPQFEFTNSEDTDLSFLSFPGETAIQSRPHYFTLGYDKTVREWAVDGGLIHGLYQTRSEEISLAFYAQTASDDDMRNTSKAIGEVKVKELLSGRSYTTSPENASEMDVFKAVITSLPLASLGTYLEGDAAAIKAVEEKLKTANNGDPSLFVYNEKKSEQANFRVLARDGEYVITKPSSDRPLVSQLKFGEGNASKVVKRLEHIARWQTILELKNSPNPRLPDNAIQMTVEVLSGECEKDEASTRLEYRRENGRWVKSTFLIKLMNTTAQTLYCTLLDLTGLYKVSAALTTPLGNNSVMCLQPKETVYAYKGEHYPIPASIPDDALEQGITEFQDILKLIVSTNEFDATLLQQGALDAAQQRGNQGGHYRNGILNHLMNNINCRDVADETPREIDGWITGEYTMTIVRPDDEVEVNPKKLSTGLSAGVVLDNQSNLQAKARLSSSNQAARSMGYRTLPDVLLSASEALKFTSERGMSPSLDVLELRVDDVKALTEVTSKAPLKVKLNQPLKENEFVLPVAFDGQFFVPLGRSQTDEDGNGEVLLERLTEPLAEGDRSVTGSISIFFRKLLREKLGDKISDQLGVKYPYPILAAAEVDENLEVEYIADIKQVSEKVRGAKNIALYIHGILGDTQSMLPSARLAQIEVDGQQKPLTEVYDLLLGFDYENLNTPIDEIAEQLRDKLAAVGLGRDHGKTLHVIAHSMGGLVSRSFIEQKGGNQVVQHLIMLGTPNAGSPWSTVQDLAFTALTFGLNSLSGVSLPVKLLSGVLGAIEAIDINLDQMNPGSDFLKGLASCDDPGIPYTIVAGNTSLIGVGDTASKSRIARFFEHLKRGALELPFVGQENDLAVSVHSIKQIPGERSPETAIKEVGCDHLVYFSHPDGLDKLAQSIQGTGLLDGEEN